MTVFIVDVAVPSDRCDRPHCRQPAALRYQFLPGRFFRSCLDCWEGVTRPFLSNDGYAFEYTRAARLRMSELGSER